jgi:hypothetical protein
MWRLVGNRTLPDTGLTQTKSLSSKQRTASKRGTGKQFTAVAS